MWVESIIQMQFPYGNIPHQWKLKNVFDHKKTKCMKLTKRW
jgi:Cu2+-containing amine oxidase